jgi:hypothetical protein
MAQPRGRGALRTNLNLTLSPAQRSQTEENDQPGAQMNHEKQSQQQSFQDDQQLKIQGESTDQLNCLKH